MLEERQVLIAQLEKSHVGGDTEEEFEESSDFIDIMLRSEIARKIWGNDASYTIRLEGDSQLQKTIDLVREATTLSDLFASAEQFSGAVAE